LIEYAQANPPSPHWQKWQTGEFNIDNITTQCATIKVAFRNNQRSEARTPQAPTGRAGAAPPLKRFQKTTMAGTRTRRTGHLQDRA
jgi:hypothetical protein